jgi:hypothetical protein
MKIKHGIIHKWKCSEPNCDEEFQNGQDLRSHRSLHKKQEATKNDTKDAKQDQPATEQPKPVAEV